MQFWYVNKKREKIFGRGALVIFFAVTLAVLAWLFPQQSVFRQQAKAGEVDAVSIAYLEVILKAAPDDASLRLNLVNQLIITGQLRRALSTLKPLIDTYPTEFQTEIDIAQLRILSQLSYAKSSSPVHRIGFQEKLETLLNNTHGKAYSLLQRERIVKVALANNMPALAARHYQSLAQSQPQLAAKWLARSAKQWLAAGEHQRVADIYLQLLEMTAGQQRAHYLTAAVQAYRMIGQAEPALSLYQRYLPKDRASKADLLSAGQLAIELARPKLALDYASRLHYKHLDNRDAQKHALSLALAIGALDLASAASLRLVQLSPNDAQSIRQLAQLYEWNGQPSEALIYWRKLALVSNTSKDLQHLQKLAGSLYDYDMVITALTRQAQLQPLDEQQVDALIFAHELNGHPEGAVRFLSKYLTDRPEQFFAWRKLALLQYRMTDVNASLDSWLEMDARFPLPVKDKQTIASLFWELDDYAAALATLKGAMHQAPSEDTEFWATLAQLAWEEEDDDLVVEALSRLKDSGGSLDLQQTSMLLTFTNPELLSLQLAAAKEGWQKSQDPLYFLAYMSLAWQHQRWDELESAMVQAAESEHLFQNRSFYWMIRAAIAERKELYKQADHHYQRALAVSMESADTVQSYLWFLSNRRQDERLREALQRWDHLALGEPSLWNVYAAANASLGNYNSALRYFSAISAQESSDLNILSAYADTLELAGHSTAAWCLHKTLAYKAEQQQGLPKTQQLNRQALIRLTSILNGEAVAKAFALQNYARSGHAEWFHAISDRLINSGITGNLARWKQLRDGKAPLSERVALAYSDADSESIQVLLDENLLDQKLRPAVLSSLLANLGHRGESMAVALANLETEAVDDQAVAMRRSVVDQLSELPSGLRIEYKNDDLGGISRTGPTLSLAQNWDEWHVSAEISDLEYNGRSLLNSIGIGSEQNIQTQLTKNVRDGAWLIEPSLSQRSDGNVQGLGISRTHILDSNLSTNVGIHWQDLADQTALMTAFAVNDRINARVNYTPNARNNVSLELSRNRFSSRAGGQNIGSGVDAALSITHRVNFSDPELQIRGGVDWMSNSVVDQIPLSIARHLITPAQNSNNLLPEEFGQVSIGARLQHGDVHAINARVPSPRYFVDAGVACQWPENQTAFTFAAGIGIPIFGDDELSFSYNFSSSPVGSDGNSAADVRASYSYRFGR